MQPLAEIIERVNDLFDGDRLAYVNGLNKGKMLQSDLLRMQAANNTKEQFANSPDLNKALLDATTDALDAHTKMSKRARESETVREWLKSMLLGPAQLYEALSQ